MTVRFCVRCGAKTGVVGLCTISPNHAPHDTPEDMVCGCGNLKKLEDAVCDECALSMMADNPIERD